MGSGRFGASSGSHVCSLLTCGDVVLAAGQPDRHVVAEAERDVVLPVEFNGAHGRSAHCGN